MPPYQFNVRVVALGTNEVDNSHLAYNSHIGPGDRFVEILNKNSDGVRDKSVFLNYVAAVALVMVGLERGAEPPADQASLKALFDREVTQLRDRCSSLDEEIQELCQLIARYGHARRGQEIILEVVPELGFRLRTVEDRA